MTCAADRAESVVGGDRKAVGMLAALSDAHLVVIAVGVGGDVDVAVIVAQAADRHPAVIIPRIARGGISERQQRILAALARNLLTA